MYRIAYVSVDISVCLRSYAVCFTADVFVRDPELFHLLWIFTSGYDGYDSLYNCTACNFVNLHAEGDSCWSIDIISQLAAIEITVFQLGKVDISVLLLYKQNQNKGPYKPQVVDASMPLRGSLLLAVTNKHIQYWICVSLRYVNSTKLVVFASDKEVSASFLLPVPVFTRVIADEVWHATRDILVLFLCHVKMIMISFCPVWENNILNTEYSPGE